MKPTLPSVCTPFVRTRKIMNQASRLHSDTSHSTGPLYSSPSVLFSTRCLKPIKNVSHVMRNPVFCIKFAKTKTQISCAVTAPLFSLHFCSLPLLPKPEIFSALAIFCGCTAWFLSELVGNPKICFLATRLIYKYKHIAQWP